MKQAIISNFDLALVVLYFIFLNAGVHSCFVRIGVIRWYESAKKKWMPCAGFCVFFWLSLAEISRYMFSYPPIDWYNVTFIISLAACSALVSDFIISIIHPKSKSKFLW